MYLRVYGAPAPQGSIKPVAPRRKDGTRGRTVLIHETGPKVKAWRAAVLAAVGRADKLERFAAGQPVEVIVIFRMTRPLADYRAGGHLADSAPAEHVKRPDLDKLLRGLLDALADAGVLADDSQVCAVSATKVWCGAGTGGAEVWVNDLHKFEVKPRGEQITGEPELIPLTAAAGATVPDLAAALKASLEAANAAHPVPDGAAF